MARRWSDEPGGLFCVLIIVLPGCRDKSLRPVAERPVLFTEIVDPRNATSGRFAGTIQPQYEVALGFRVAGRMATRHAQIGQQVRKGDLLATLDPGDQQHQLRARQAEVGKASSPRYRRETSTSVMTSCTNAASVRGRVWIN